MSGAGGSAERWAAQLRDEARRGLWRRVLTLLGVTVHTRAADAKAVDCEAGAEGERRTAELLRPLQAEGWTVLHDRAIPGAHSANADHVLVSPGALVFLVDSKLWSAHSLVHVRNGRLRHGEQDRHKAVASLQFEADLVARALRTPVQPLIAVHNAPVAFGGLFVEGIPVVPAGRLLEVLRRNDGPRNPGALWLAQHADAALPRYR
jgi:hypothetical protein